MSEEPPFVTPFGTLLGQYQGVEGFSNGSDHHFSGEQNIVNGKTTGIKYQCVEYARRWLISKGLTFSGVSFAAHIWNLRHLERLLDKKLTTIKPVKNGSFFPPIPESFLIWKTAPDVPVGHIAVITEVNVESNYIRIAEQNVDNDYWPGDYSRQLKLEVLDGAYFIRDEDEVFGWMIINFDVDNVDESELRLTDIVKKHQINSSDNLWVDVANPIEQKFIEAWGSLNNLLAYYTIESHVAYKIQMATLECNYLASLATKHALQSDETLRKLLIPEWLWPRLRESFTNYWESNGKFLITSIDFAFNGKSLKMIEYHGDSAFGIVEAAVLQEKWAKHYHCEVGKSSTENVLANLIQQCKDSLKGFVHIMIDNNPYHEYTAFFLQKVLNDAEIGNKLIYGTDFVLIEADKYADSDGLEIKNVWKLWDWETVIQDYEKPRIEGTLKISDLLLCKTVNVFEPIWKIVTENNGLLPILWELNPNHNYLLRAEWDDSGYFADKPRTLKKIGFKKGNQTGPFVHQETFETQQSGEYFVIAKSWRLGVRLSGFSLKERLNDQEVNSPFVCCRIVGDDYI